MHVRISPRSARLAAAILCLSVRISETSFAQSDFTKLPGTARSIGVGANGALWVIGTGKVGNSGDFNIFRWTGSGWQATAGSGVKIAADPEGNALVLNSAGELFRYSFAGTPPWEQFPGAATDVASGPKGELWIGTRPPGSQTPDGKIFRWTQSKWERAPGSAVQIAVAPDGSPWVINSENELYQRDMVKKTWIQHTAKLRSIAIGASGAKFAVSTEAAAGGNYTIIQEIGGSWIARLVAGVAVAVGPAGEPYVLNAAGEIYRGTPVPGPIVVGGELNIEREPGLNPVVITPAAAASWSRALVLFSGGKTTCSGLSCGTTRADWVGHC